MSQQPCDHALLRISTVLSFYLKVAIGKVCSLSPFLRGEGWGEGLCANLSELYPLTRLATSLLATLSPQAGRGKKQARYIARALPQSLSDDQMPRSRRKRSIGAELAIERMR